MTEPYRPIACSLHDELEARATLRRECEIRFRVAGAPDEGVARGRVRDIFARDGAEYLVLDDGREVRLDHIVAVDGTPFQRDC
ncbi:MAG TPA: hypothetical protein VF212_04550 [Longimicrobiales bacterium]